MLRARQLRRRDLPAEGRRKEKKTLRLGAFARKKIKYLEEEKSSSLLQLDGLSATANRQSPSKEKRLAREDAKAQRN